MEPINETNFDIVIAGTGLAQSLLALSLSRADKKVLHLDRNGYYGGTEAALSLQDAAEWAERVNKESLNFTNAQVVIHNSNEADDEASGSTLGFSRAYSLALAPQIVYSKSVLLPTLVSSKVYRQLEFLAVGAWWIYQYNAEEGDGSLRKIPGSREDIFADNSFDLKAKRSLMKFLKFITDSEAFSEAITTWGSSSLETFLSEQYGIPPQLQPTLHALTLSPVPAYQTKTSFALPRILRHLSSIGVFGPSFGAVIPKWGGLAEIAQVGCRACAVGGGIYMLGQGIDELGDKTSDGRSRLKLDNGEEVKTDWIAGQSADLQRILDRRTENTLLTRSVSIVASALPNLFPLIADGAPPSACAVVVFPPGSLRQQEMPLPMPVYVLVHSSETGECPQGQSVLYASIQAPTDEGRKWIEFAITTLLKASAEDGEIPRNLWTLFYSQTGLDSKDSSQEDLGPSVDDQTITFSDSSVDLAFDDSVVREVRRAWQHVTGNTNGFMEFEDREVGEYDDDG